jgi:hypothetical protein
MASILFFDCEGIGNQDRKCDFDAKIFALASLFSSRFVYNAKETLKSIDMEVFQHIANIVLKSQEKSGGNRFFADNFPILQCIIRDSDGSFASGKDDDSTIDAQQYLEARFDRYPTLRKIFKKRFCTWLPRPVESDADLKRLDTDDESLFEPEFTNTINILIKSIYEETPLKSFDKGLVDGYGFLKLVDHFVDQLNASDSLENAPKEFSLNTTDLQESFDDELMNSVSLYYDEACFEWEMMKNNLYIPDTPENIDRAYEECVEEVYLTLSLFEYKIGNSVAARKFMDDKWNLLQKSIDDHFGKMREKNQALLSQPYEGIQLAVVSRYINQLSKKLQGFGENFFTLKRYNLLWEETRAHFMSGAKLLLPQEDETSLTKLFETHREIFYESYRQKYVLLDKSQQRKKQLNPQFSFDDASALPSYEDAVEEDERAKELDYPHPAKKTSIVQ